MGGDHNGDNFPSLPEFQTVNDEDESTGISVVDFMEDKPSTYDIWLSQYTTISSSACFSIKGDNDYDDNKSLFDLTLGKSHLSLEAKAPSIDYSWVKPNKRSGIKLCLNPPNPPTPKILLRVKPSEPQKRCDPVKKNGGGARTPVPTIKKSRQKRCI
ncbi:MAG: hypothetical protein M1840_007451 [Geoglossum simile]|nr:MAG: hypothetical protein M1840_007451 [Geoglossum simile]